MLSALWSLVAGNLSEIIAGLSGLVGVLSAFLWGRERTKRKAAEKDVQRANQIEKDVNDAKRNLANDTRPLDERLRELDGLRDPD